jgi:hypothetical protein
VYTRIDATDTDIPQHLATVFRCAQELLNNVPNTQAQHVSVTLSLISNKTLIVCDDGIDLPQRIPRDPSAPAMAFATWERAQRRRRFSLTDQGCGTSPASIGCSRSPRNPRSAHLSPRAHGGRMPLGPLQQIRQPGK